jgi:hypothetical protein
MEYLPILSLFALAFIGYRIEKLHNLMAEWKSDWNDANGIAAQRWEVLEEPDQEDELYQKAKELVIEARKASTSYSENLALGTLALPIFSTKRASSVPAKAPSHARFLIEAKNTARSERHRPFSHWCIS